MIAVFTMNVFGLLLCLFGLLDTILFWSYRNIFGNGFFNCIFGLFLVWFGFVVSIYFFWQALIVMFINLGGLFFLVRFQYFNVRFVIGFAGTI